MSRTYQATGIILKGMPLGEADRLVTILSPEWGLIRAVVPGARKPKSSLRGRCELFMVNQLLIAKGRSLDKITQADTIESYPGLSKDLGKLAGSQYLAELVLSLALIDQPQGELYGLLNEHLRRLEKMSTSESLHGYLAQAVFHLLAIAGIAPQVYRCCLTQNTLNPNFSDPNWRVGFSFEAGGVIDLALRDSLKATLKMPVNQNSPSVLPTLNNQLRATELSLLQQLNYSSLPHPGKLFPAEILDSLFIVPWVEVEHLLRDYAQYQLGRSFRSATLVDSVSSMEF
ncbi:DNA repair protein RecO [Crocosphaera sp. XPORK-15E]|uniref:DNA repair protein RecO n=1 Tax=Crocosphaera sp. XPORK-15E TaxID=3110247 RepID=UPI002B20B87B|nr:DNA repair protein RecO [Crocosphaera sp. XPORK-15E]MEA5535862.1 DNA repair protein RecO [Crocosphaera sp. XPORK-15E]